MPRALLPRIADLTWRAPKTVLALVGAILVAAGLFARDVEDHLKQAGFTDSESESQVASTELRDALGYDAVPGIVLLVRDPDGGKLDLSAAPVRAEIDRLTGELADTRYIARAVNPLEVPRELRTNAIAADGRSVVISGHLGTGDTEDLGGLAAEDAEGRIAGSSLDVSMGGYAPSFNQVNDQTREDLTTAELIAFPALTVLLLLIFRGVIAAAIPLLIGVVAIAGTFIVLRVMSELVDTSLFALNIATALSLGLAVDYALLMVSRYREELERDGPTREAHRRTVLTAGHAVMFSGLTVAAALAALVLMPQRFLYSIGAAGASVGILAMLIALLVVPAVLRLAGARINTLSLRKGPGISKDSDRWNRLARRVMSRPIAFAAGSAALLLLAASPLLFTKITGPSAEAVAPGLPAFEPNEYLEDHYPRGVIEAVVVTVDGQASKAALAETTKRIDAIDPVSLQAPFQRAGDGLAHATFALDGPALNSRSQDAVREIRDLSAGTGTELLVSGNTAQFLDQKESLVQNGIPVVLIVAASMLVLLFGLTRSILLPLKTLLMNALTLAATLGIVVLAFQEGWLSAPLDYTGPQAIEVISLVFIFALTFGLATDYAVLVMARIKEAKDDGMTNEDAVAHGIGRTGRVITAAAVMLATVFLAFAVSPIFFMKQIAVAMAVGVLLDATIVRGLLVPALMRLFGEWNWWAPRWLPGSRKRAPVAPIALETEK